MYMGKVQTTLYLNFSQIHRGSKKAKPLHILLATFNEGQISALSISLSLIRLKYLVSSLLTVN